MAMTSKVSQQRIAKDLGVSQTLVSLALNGRKDSIAPETYKRIWDRAVSLGYSPKGMRIDPTVVENQLQQVGFILRSGVRLYWPSNFFGHVQHGLHRALEAQGRATVFLGAEDLLTPEKLRRLFRPGHTIHGVVLLGEVARPFLEQLRGLVPNIVTVSGRFPGLCHSVQGNDAQALELLVRDLHARGHRRFAWLGGNIGLGRHESRLAACRTALSDFDLVLDARYTITLRDADRAEGAEAVHALLPHRQRRDFPTAFICYNSTMAAGAVRALQREGLRVPQDISVAGADVSHVNTAESPHITGAGTDPEKLGEVAGKLVLGEGVPAEGFVDLVLPAQLLAGESVGAPKAK